MKVLGKTPSNSEGGRVLTPGGVRYLDRLQLEESQELNLLASVGNRYSLHHLQHAAVLLWIGRTVFYKTDNPRTPS